MALQKKHLTEARSYRSALNASQSSLSTAESENAQLKAALAEIQTENKTLQAKLAAVRSTSVNVESSSNYKTPGSAVKGKSHTTRTVMVGSQEAARAAQTAQLKEDLYSDLTGLILRGIDRQEYCDIYDCIQTGRNGSTSPSSSNPPLPFSFILTIITNIIIAI